MRKKSIKSRITAWCAILIYLVQMLSVGVFAVGDTTAPTAPKALTAPSKTATSVKLSWTASTDNVGVTGYVIYKGTTQAGSVTGTTTYVVTGLTANTAYSFTVKAKDAAGNVSAASTALSVKTLAPDTTAPTAPKALTAPSKTATTVKLSWTASTDNVGVTGYVIYKGTTQAGSVTGTTSYVVTGLAANTAYSFTVKAKDAAGNVSAASTALSVKTLAADTTAPTAPKALTAISKTATTVNLSWTASTDNVGVTGYVIYKGTTQAGSVTGTTTYVITGLTANTTYSFTVKAKDAAGNVSAASTALSVTTTATADTTAPSVPTALTAPSKTATTVNLSWTASTDNVGVKGYDIYKGTTLAGSTTGATTYVVTGLTANTAYSFTVKAKDAAGNVSAASTALSVTTALASDTTAPSMPTALTAPSKTITTVNLAWKASTDNVGVTGYDIYNGATSVGSSTTTSYIATELTANTAYSFTVKAKDATGNVSATSATVSVTTIAADKIAPSVPTGLVIISVTDSSVKLTWNPSTDNIAVKEYAIFKDGIYLDSSPSTTYTVLGLHPNEKCVFSVKAADEVYNISAESTSCSAITTVSNMNQLEVILIRNFEKKGIKCNLTYTGDCTNFSNDINNAISGAIEGTSVPFIIQQSTPSASGNVGNLNITFEFVYDSCNYSVISYTLDEIKTSLTEMLNNRSQNINLVYKGEITGTNIDDTLNSILKNDTYLKSCISNSSYSMSSSLGNTGNAINLIYQ